jgi:hypothetical protein
MPDMALIQGAITGLKSAGDIAKSFLELKSIADVQGKVIELQSAILSAQGSALAAQGEQSSMVQKPRDLEEEIANVKAWKETAKHYALVSPWTGAFVYALKKESGSSEPPHWLWQKCYEDGKKSILQRAKDGPVSWTYDCAQCKTNLHLHGGWFLKCNYAEDTQTQSTDR